MPRSPDAVGPPKRHRGHLMPLLEAIYASFDPQELCERYLEAIPQWITASAYGFYVFNERTGEPLQIRAIGVSPRFLRAYEEHCRALDPLLRPMWRRPLPRSTDEDVPLREWRRHAMAELFATEGHYRYMLAPLTVDGRLVGTLNFARRPSQPPFGPRDLEAVDLAARHVSRALTCGALVERAEKRARRLEQALHRLPVPVAITAGQEEPFLNQAARRLLSEVDGPHRPHLPPLTAERGQPHRRVAHRPPSPQDGAAVGVRSLLLNEADQSQLHLLWSSAATPPWSEAAAVLSPRERELVNLLAQGLRNTDLAQRLGISVNTVKQHLKRLFHKLGVRNRAEAVTRALGRPEAASAGSACGPPGPRPAAPRGWYGARP